MNEPADLRKFNINQVTTLDFKPSWPDPIHQFSKKEAMAIIAAQLIGRPLLIEGPPGSGKTQIAAAAAIALGRALISYVVNSDTAPEDLLWRYDALQRLNDAQAKSIVKPEKYLYKGPLWLAYGTEQDGKDIPCSIETYNPKSVEGEPQGKVILIDEIDKADRSVPNSLLEVFGHRRFYCPHLQQHIGVQRGDQQAPSPLIIITSNREQQLPAAFVRRCLVLRVDLPSNENEFVKLMAERGQMHYGTDTLTGEQYCEIAQALWAIRNESGLPEEMQPGQAEYLDLVRAIKEALSGKLKDTDGVPVTFQQLLADLQALAFDKAKSLRA